MFKNVVLAPTFWRTIIGAHLLLATASFAQEPEVFYNLSDDPDSLQLLDLSNIGHESGHDYLNVIDLYRGELKHGLISTWDIDCARERMGIVNAMQFDPKSSDHQVAIKGEVISARSSPRSWTMFKLTCDGKGQLLERQVFHGPLRQIVTQFWGS